MCCESQQEECNVCRLLEKVLNLGIANLVLTGLELLLLLFLFADLGILPIGAARMRNSMPKYPMVFKGQQDQHIYLNSPAPITRRDVEQMVEPSPE